MRDDREFKRALDQYITGVNDPDAPFNREIDEDAYGYDELSHTAQHKVMTALRQIRRAKSNLMFFGTIRDTFEEEIEVLRLLEVKLGYYIAEGVRRERGRRGLPP